MHLSKVDSNAKLRIMKGLKVIDLCEHLPHVTTVICIPFKQHGYTNANFTAKKLVND